MLIVSDTARLDLKEIWSYIVEHSVDSANKIIRELAKKFDLLEANPNLGRSQDDFIIGMRMFPFKKYHIYYFPIEDGVEIYRVLHGRRDAESEFEDFFEGMKK